MNPGTPEYVVSVATQSAANSSSNEFIMLSQKMCWDAVGHCLVLGGILQRDYAQGNQFMVPATCNPVPDTRMSTVPPGSVLAFYDGDRVAHMMLYLGGMKGAGNKNDCIGIGRSVGWEVLDFSQLKWLEGGQINAPGGSATGRTLVIRYRPCTEL